LSGISSNLRATEGPNLAKQLGVLLDRNPNFEVAHLSNSPEGDTTDGFTPGLDNLASFDAGGVPIVLQMHRVTQQGTQIWLVTSASVARIPELSALSEESPIEKKLPAPLVKTRFIGTPIWVWIALVLLAIVLSALSELLSRGFIAVLKPLTKHYAKSFHVQRLNALKEPLRLLIVVVVFRACLVLFPTSALSRDYILKLLVLLFVLGAAALAMRIVDVISDQITSRLNPRERALSYSVLPLAIRVVKIVIFCIGVLWVLAAWGYNTNAILAGIGVGGLAVALAAQKTIENLFGGVSLIIDRPVLVGDFCQFGGQVGTIEDIGLRSTRIRTLDRTVVTIPNSQFSTMTLENFSKRERVWFHPTLGLSRTTTPEQVHGMMDAIAKILQEHKLVDASGVPVRFTKIADQSLNLEIFAYVLTADFNEFLKIQTELLLKFLEAAGELNIAFSVPITEALTIPYEANVLSRGFISPAELPQNVRDQTAAAEAGAAASVQQS
jgi:MscS family membrane protein